MKKTRMFVRSYKSIGFVDAGACEGADILIAKRAEAAPVDEAKRAEVAAKLQAAAPELSAKMDEVAQTFGEIAASEAAEDEIESMLDGLRESFCSIIDDPAADKPAMLTQSLGEFASAVLARIPDWTGTTAKAGRTLSAASLTKINAALDGVKSALDSLSTLIAATGGNTEDNMKTEKQAADNAADLDTVTKRATEAEAKVAELQAEVDALKAKIPVDPEEALKAVPADIRKRLENAEKIAREERDLRVTGEFVAKADALGQPREFGLVLKRIAENAATDADNAELCRVLKAQHEQIKTAGLFTEVGRDGSDSGDAVARVNAAARALVEKGDAPTIEQAIVKVMKTDRKLAAEYRAAAHS